MTFSFIDNAVSIAKRIFKEIPRDRMSVPHLFIFPALAIYIVKIFADGISYADPADGLAPRETLAAGFACFVVHISAFGFCARVFVRERIGGALERVQAIGVSPASVVAGYVCGFAPFVLVQSLALAVASALIFGVSFRGAAWAVPASAFLLGVVSVAMSMFTSGAARRGTEAFAAIPLILPPALLLGEVIFPLEALPAWLNALSYAFPMRYAIEPLNAAITCEMAGCPARDFFGLIVYGIAMFALATVFFRHREAAPRAVHRMSRKTDGG